MKNKKIQELSIDELTAKLKALRTLLIVLSSLVLLYAIFFITKLILGTWQANNTLGIVGLGVLVVVISNLTIRMSVIGREIKSRNIE
jgi:uncharacterized membrane protein YcjF (UPF0283 family)